jgi:hypothetical protein
MTEHFHIAEWRILEWEKHYYPLNVRQEIEHMQNWLEANPKRRKKNYNRFVVNWLNRNYAQVATAQALTRIQARAGAQSKKEGCWVDGVRIA